jgi:hypothetical protein
VIENYRYQGPSAIVNGLTTAHVAFATNTLREATYFRGELGQPLLFREALTALHDVVVSDFKYRPRDRVAFQAWLEEQDQKFLASLALRGQQARKRMEELEARRAELDEARRQRRAPFYRARQAFFEYVYQNEYELALLLDPVITVHPDEVSFEAFSRDESTYARLAAKSDLFAKVDEYACGTTNIDFSPRLHGELERMRTYRRTRFDIDPSGLTVASTGSDAYKEKKIDLPESWVMGFLQVHSVMALGLTRFRMAPVDLFNIARALRRRKARTSPRALRYELTPGQRVKVVLEPWEQVIELSPGSVFDGPKPVTVRTWGRDRLRVAARLLPVCSGVDVYLAGFGLPSVYVFDLGPAVFTLALSGWTDNDWTSGKAKFDLLTRRLTVSAAELTQVYQALRQARAATDGQLAAATGLSVEKCRSAASHLCQTGRAMFDLAGGVFRHRELFLEPFTPQEAAAAVKSGASETDPQAKEARRVFERSDIRVIARRPVTTGFKLSGSARGDEGPRVRPQLHVDRQGAILEASCTCGYYRSHKLTRGPCAHILALRLAHMSRLEEENQR